MMKLFITTNHIKHSMEYLEESSNYQCLRLIRRIFDFPNYKNVELEVLNFNHIVNLLIKNLSPSEDFEVIDFVELLKILLEDNFELTFEVKYEYIFNNNIENRS